MSVTALVYRMINEDKTEFILYTCLHDEQLLKYNLLDFVKSFKQLN
jgi:hypothetical protein